jgi:hypothetical protein
MNTVRVRADVDVGGIAKAMALVEAMAKFQDRQPIKSIKTKE